MNIKLISIVSLPSVGYVLVIRHAKRGRYGVNVLLLVGCVNVLNGNLMTPNISICFVPVNYQRTTVARLATFSTFIRYLSTYLGRVVVPRVYPTVPRIVLLCPKGVNGTIVVTIIYLYFVLMVHRR